MFKGHCFAKAIILQVQEFECDHDRTFYNTIVNMDTLSNSLLFIDVYRRMVQMRNNYFKN